MWDESLIESRQKRSGKWGWSTVSISVVVHAIGILIVMFATFWNVEAVPPTFPPQQFVQSAGIPVDNIPVVIVRKGNPDGDDKPVKPADTVVLEPAAPVTQESIDPNSDLDAVSDTPQSTVPFSLGSDTDYGSGPIGSPHGNSTDGLPYGTGVGEPERIIDITVGVEQPVLIHRVVPEYPESMRRSRKSGIVVLKAIVNRYGDVEVKEVQRSLHPILDREAISAVNQWKYHPATVNGRPVSVWFTVTVSFKLV